jgi:hypothetical protein
MKLTRLLQVSSVVAISFSLNCQPLWGSSQSG